MTQSEKQKPDPITIGTSEAKWSWRAGQLDELVARLMGPNWGDHVTTCSWQAQRKFAHRKWRYYESGSEESGRESPKLQPEYKKYIVNIWISS